MDDHPVGSQQRNGGGAPPHHADLEWRETVRGRKPGDQVVRIATHRGFQRVRPGYLVPRSDGSEQAGRLGRFMRLVLGDPIPTAHESHERLTKVKALAVFSSDALSSVAYATEEIMKVLVLGGAALLSLTLPISLAIVALLAIVVLSYRQTIRAYPSGGGSYIVASANLGQVPGLTAAASLLIDYVLTVSVSVAAGVAALTSLAPALLDWSLVLSIGFVAFIAVLNLRGIRESGSIFAVPTYVFVGLMYLLIGVGLFRWFTGGLSYTPPESALEPGNQQLGLFLLMAAFAQGCTAMTGTEAISNGVPAFKAPEAHNARVTLVSMGLVLGTMFFGVSFLAAQVGLLPAESETVLSQLGRVVFGSDGPGTVLWVLLQVFTALILVLAANTSFADFPRLASILARDRFLPRVFEFRGDRLAFNSGIVVLALLAVALLAVFEGSLDALIPLYAVGVFTSFTLSQCGMVVHWRQERSAGWRRSAVINCVGAVVTGIVTLVIAYTKFMHGAWLVVVLIPIIIVLLRGIHRHYASLEGNRDAETPLDWREVRVRTVVPIAGLDVIGRQALAYAKAIAHQNERVVALHVAESLAEAEAFEQEWDHFAPEFELVIVESPYRSLIGPLLSYVDALRQTHPADTVNVVLPEFVVSHWWEHLLHNQTALRLKAALLFHPGIVVTSVPYHLG